MAIPGIGFKKVYQMLMEISFHLLEPVSITTLTAAVAPGLNSVTLASTVNLIQGSEVVVDPGQPNEEAIFLAEVTSTSIEALFQNSHTSCATLLGACFPTQVETDPFYTQSEIISYISRAQNEF